MSFVVPWSDHSSYVNQMCIYCQPDIVNIFECILTYMNDHTALHSFLMISFLICMIFTPSLSLPPFISVKMRAKFLQKISRITGWCVQQYSTSMTGESHCVFCSLFTFELQPHGRVGGQNLLK